MTKRETAVRYFCEGYNCAQSVLLAFCEDFGLSTQQAASMALSFGGGMGQMRETCGALTGAFMVLGLAEQAALPPTPTDKCNCYQKVRTLAEAFSAENGSLLCRELLALAQSGTKKKKSCAELVGSVAEQLEEYLS